MDDRVPRNNGNAVIHFLEGNLGVNIAQAYKPNANGRSGISGRVKGSRFCNVQT